MADMLATDEDLAVLIDDAGLDEDRATLLLELATGEVQAAAGQRIVLVEDDPFEMFGFTDAWLELKEGPVVEISSLTIDDGDELERGTDYKWVSGSRRLFRHCGWATCWWEPSTIAGAYTHGLADDDQRIQFARSSTLGIAKLAATNASGVLAESIDDYRVQYAAAVLWAMEKSPYLAKALRRTYGDRAGLVRLG